MTDALETIRNPLTGEAITFIRTAKQTGGRQTIVEAVLRPGGKGPPLHVHTAFTETFEVLEGTLTLQVGRATTRLGEGQRSRVELRERHTFWSESGRPVRFRCTIEPGSTDVENCGRIAFGLARDGLVSDKGVPKRMWHLIILSALSQSRMAGILSVLSPVLTLLSRTSRCREIQNALIRRYCFSAADMENDVHRG